MLFGMATLFVRPFGLPLPAGELTDFRIRYGQSTYLFMK